MDKLACSGSETDVALCKSDGFGPKACARNRKAAIYCGLFLQFLMNKFQGIGKSTYLTQLTRFNKPKYIPKRADSTRYNIFLLFLHVKNCLPHECSWFLMTKNVKL